MYYCTWTLVQSTALTAVMTTGTTVYEYSYYVPTSYILPHTRYRYSIIILVQLSLYIIMIQIIITTRAAK